MTRPRTQTHNHNAVTALDRTLYIAAVMFPLRPTLLFSSHATRVLVSFHSRRRKLTQEEAPQGRAQEDGNITRAAPKTTLFDGQVAVHISDLIVMVR